MTEELVGKISYKNNKVRVKVTYELECDSISGGLLWKFVRLDVIPVENKLSNIESKSKLIVNDRSSFSFSKYPEFKHENITHKSFKLTPDIILL